LRLPEIQLLAVVPTLLELCKESRQISSSQNFLFISYSSHGVDLHRTKNDCKNSCMVFDDLLAYIISEPYVKWL
jgi:hypothetical protein